MHLAELVACTDTGTALPDELETLLTQNPGKGVIRALDTPNLLANCIGIFSWLATVHPAERLGLPFERVDALTGTRIGRPKGATFRTADVAGPDVMAHAIDTLEDPLHDDPWWDIFFVPACLDAGADQQRRTRAEVRRRRVSHGGQ
jgi:3-hydroxyacyl-CoA dehydrogenase